MIKVRQVPVVVEAFHFKDVSCVDGLIEFVGNEHIDGYTNTEEPEKPIPLYYVLTRNGGVRVCEGDWIIKGVTGDFRLCKPDEFEKIYEVVDETGIGLDGLEAAKAGVIKEKNMHRYCTKQSCAELRRHLDIAANCIGIVEELLKCNKSFGFDIWKVADDTGINTTICGDGGMFIAEDECFSMADAKHIVSLHNLWLKAVAAFGGKGK